MNGMRSRSSERSGIQNTDDDEKQQHIVAQELHCECIRILESGYVLPNHLLGSDAASRRRLACRLVQRFQSDVRLFVTGFRRIFRIAPVPCIREH